MSALMEHAEPVVIDGEEIPFLDIGSYLAGDDAALEPLAARLRDIQQNIGFYYIVNHGVPRGLIRDAFGELKRFFELPEAEKMKLKPVGGGRGYIPPKSSVYVTSPVNRNTKGDLNEVLILTRERPADHPAVLQGLRFHGPNQWPGEDVLPGFRTKMLEYYATMEALGRRLLPLYARALDLPADYFTPLFEDPMWTTRNAHYPPVEPEENQFGISPHRDHGFLTLLPLSDVPGLEIMTQSGKWLPADFVEDAIIVNTGEFLNRWTNGRFLATPHRVIPPRVDRYSIAFFFNPTWDTVADPLPTCVSQDEPAQFYPVRMHDYLAWYVDRNFKKSAGGQQGQSPDGDIEGPERAY
ncbi:MAG: 2-oxoglutarate and iron-dependent oxygenase domain-containing protein [Alphaproteobacteria bacterium]|jgi:isopenicillin N synthase-like dioxygenase